jgi:Galactose oxidase, central domain
MNDHELEQRLSAWYRAEIGEATAAPLPLRLAVDAIPTREARPWHARRRPLLLLAAALAAGIGGALAVGSGLLRLPSVSPNPSTLLGVTTPTPTATLNAGPTTSPVVSPIPAMSPLAAEAGFRSISDMATPRYQHTATLLADGRVLIAGGRSLQDPLLATTELWDPTTEAFTSGPPLVVGRFGHTATRPIDGRVLIVGGVATSRPMEAGTRQIELWDPATGTFRAAGLTTFPHTAALSTVLLADGRVLIIGGVDCNVLPDGTQADRAARLRCQPQLLTTEIWDPATESVTPTGSLEQEHDWASAKLLADGRVFVLGGGALPTIGSEVWDPATGAWSRGGAPTHARLGGQSATLLRDGSVLVVGGQTGTLNGDPFPPPLRAADVWDPATSSFSPSGAMGLGRERHTATLLADGRVLIVGGVGEPAADFSDTAVTEAEIWDPATGSFSSAGQDAAGRALHTATLLPDGRVLITGGFTRVERAEVTRDTASAVIWAP